MMTFEKYMKTLDKIGELEDRLKYKIEYRILELCGPRHSATTQCISRPKIGPEEERVIDKDPIITELRRQVREMEDRCAYVRGTGELPEAMVKAVENWEMEANE